MHLLQSLFSVRVMYTVSELHTEFELFKITNYFDTNQTSLLLDWLLRLYTHVLIVTFFEQLILIV